MADAATEGKKKGPMKWYYVALITAVVIGAVVYFMWPKYGISAKADIKYDPLTGKAYPAGTTPGYSPTDGTALTS